MLHIHLHLDTTIIRTGGRNLGKFKQSNALLDIVRVKYKYLHNANLERVNMR